MERLRRELEAVTGEMPASLCRLERYEGREGRASGAALLRYDLQKQKYDPLPPGRDNAATGVIAIMINSQHGFIKFGLEEKAIFNAKSLFKDC